MGRGNGRGAHPVEGGEQAGEHAQGSLLWSCEVVLGRPYRQVRRAVPARVEVAGASMRPALEPGDRLLVVPWGWRRVGAVVALSDPREPTRTILKRVAEVRPDGALVVLGDAPGASTDSRTFGPVPPSLVRGRAVWRYQPARRRGPVR